MSNRAQQDEQLRVLKLSLADRRFQQAIRQKPEDELAQKELIVSTFFVMQSLRKPCSPTSEQYLTERARLERLAEMAAEMHCLDFPTPVTGNFRRDYSAFVTELNRRVEALEKDVIGMYRTSKRAKSAAVVSKSLSLAEQAAQLRKKRNG